MNLTLHIHVHMVDDGKIDQILTKLQQIQDQEILIMADLVTLEAQVAASTTVEASAVTLIQGIAAQLATAIAGNDPAKIQALQDQLKNSADALAAAVAKNTPAGPPPVPVV